MTTPSAPGDPADVVRRRLLGVGLRADLVSAADTARDLGLRRTDGGVDLDLVVGIDNLTQCLALGLATLRGTDVFNTRYGFLGLTPMVEQTSPVLIREGVRGAVAEFVSGDPRVRRILDLQAGNPLAPPGGGARALDVTVRFEAVSGEELAVSTAGLAPGAAVLEALKTNLPTGENK